MGCSREQQEQKQICFTLFPSYTNNLSLLRTNLHFKIISKYIHMLGITVFNEFFIWISYNPKKLNSKTRIFLENLKKHQIISPGTALLQHIKRTLPQPHPFNWLPTTYTHYFHTLSSLYLFYNKLYTTFTRVSQLNYFSYSHSCGVWSPIFALCNCSILPSYYCYLQI